MRRKSNEERLAGLARRQHGVVARRRLLALGVSSSAIGRRVDTGRLHVVHAGVYAVGHPLLSRDGRWLAAVLACGPRAAIGYATAAFEWSRRRREPPVIEVVSPTDVPARMSGSACTGTPARRRRRAGRSEA